MSGDPCLCGDTKTWHQECYRRAIAHQAPAAKPLTDEQLKCLLPPPNYISDGYGYTGMQVWAYGKLIERAHKIGIAPSAQGEPE